MDKKGQSEIIGLAIVVVLLIFALVFFVTIKNNENEIDSKLIRTNLRANSALNAIMKVNVNDKQMNELIEECFIGKQEECDMALTSLELHLDNIFEEKYYFRVLDGSDQILGSQNGRFEFGKNCKVSISASPYVFRGFGKAELKICT